MSERLKKLEGSGFPSVYQGRTGEQILLNILRSSSLVENRDYFYKGRNCPISFSTEKGSVLEPDFVFKVSSLYFVCDVKTSLLSYYRCVSSIDNSKRDFFKKKVISSYTSHVRSLSSKQYSRSASGNVFDVVFIFVPLDSIYLMVLSDSRLVSLAHSRNISFVSPSSILPIVHLLDFISFSLSLSSIRGSIALDQYLTQISDSLLEDVQGLQKIAHILDFRYNNLQKKIFGSRGLKSFLRKKLDS